MKKRWIARVSGVLCGAIWLNVPSRSWGDVISYLRFEEGSGFTAADQSGLMNGDLIQFSFPLEGWSTDVPSLTVPQSGEQNNYSVRFGGGSEFIDLSNANDVNLGTSFTIEYYFKAEEPFIGSLFFGLTGGFSLSVTISAPQPEILFGLYFQGTLDIIVASNVSYNTWQHFALVKEPGGYEVYIDGLLIADESLPPGTDGPYLFTGTALTGDRTIGGDDGTFRGWIDEFRISDEALTPDQFLMAPWKPDIRSIAVSGDVVHLLISNRVAGITTIVERADGLVQPTLWETTAVISVHGNTTNWTGFSTNSGAVFYRVTRYQ